MQNLFERYLSILTVKVFSELMDYCSFLVHTWAGFFQNFTHFFVGEEATFYIADRWKCKPHCYYFLHCFVLIALNLRTNLNLSFDFMLQCEQRSCDFIIEFPRKSPPCHGHRPCLEKNKNYLFNLSFAYNHMIRESCNL